jgi:hypothetical protein
VGEEVSFCVHEWETRKAYGRDFIEKEARQNIVPASTASRWLE